MVSSVSVSRRRSRERGEVSMNRLRFLKARDKGACGARVIVD